VRALVLSVALLGAACTVTIRENVVTITSERTSVETLAPGSPELQAP
jgi:hypothetical protein